MEFLPEAERIGGNAGMDDYFISRIFFDRCLPVLSRLFSAVFTAGSKLFTRSSLMSSVTAFRWNLESLKTFSAKLCSGRTNPDSFHGLLFSILGARGMINRKMSAVAITNDSAPATNPNALSAMLMTGSEHIL